MQPSAPPIAGAPCAGLPSHFSSRATRPAPLALGALALTAALAAGCSRGGDESATAGDNGDGTAASIEEGRALFREGTLGLDRLLSDGLGLDSGLARAGFTTRNALEVGLQLDANSISSGLLSTLVSELTGTSSGTSSGAPPAGSGGSLDDPAVFATLLDVGAIVGLVGVEVDGIEGLDLLGADRVGLSCALCHSMVDGSVYDGSADGALLPGSIGVRMDGPAPAELRLGALFAYADRSRLLYPYLPQSHQTVGGFPIARSEAFVTEEALEQDVDAILTDEAAFPPGLWDMTPDGIGNPTVMPPVYDIRPAAPYGIAGEFSELVDALNAHVSLGLDPTFLLTDMGRVFIDRIGLGIGTEIANEYDAIVASSGLQTPAGGFPFLDAEATSVSSSLESPVGLRIDQDDLRLFAIYLQSLVEPAKTTGISAARERGEAAYELACADCHGAFGALEPHGLVSLLDLVTPYAPTTLLARGFPYSDVLDDTLKTYDDRLVLFDRLFSTVQVPAQAREIAAPHLTGLHLRSMFLHDGSVESLDALMDPVRGAGAPHPFFVEPGTRSDLIEFLTTD